MKKFCFIIILTAIATQGSFAQIAFNFGPELGMAISRFPKSNDYTSVNNNVDEKTSPLYSPLAGVHVQMIVKKLFLFTSGIQYQMTGQHYVFHNEGYDTLNQLPFVADVDEKQKFQELCLPLSAGITFPFLKLHLSIYGGWRLDYFFSGKYSNKTTVDYSKNSIDVNETADFNPLKKDECALNIKPFNNQLFYGISLSKGRFEVAINRYVGRKISYSQELQVKNYIDFKNNCNSITLRYRFFSFRNEKTKCNLFANK
jgi:hypothetical protein